MKKICVLVFFLLLMGCDKSVQEENAVAVNISSSYNEIKPYNIYQQEDYILNKYEQEDKCYSGVYIEQTEGDFIKEFEEFTGTTNSIYMYNQRIDEPYPLSWVLNCYSNLKTPFITILPPEDNNNLFNTILLKNLANDFGTLQIPMFVNIYPLDNKFLGNEEEYISFLQSAKTYFELYAPNVAIVWSVDKSLIYSAEQFYPGDDCVDWLGIDIYEDIDKNNNLNIMFEELDFFYQKYADKKPIFLNVAISHFSSTSYNYNIDEKIEELNRFFYTIPIKYNRVKMINYINTDTFKSDSLNKQNYLLTDNKKILEAYKNVLNSDIFLDTVIFSDNSRNIKEEKKLNILAYKINDEFFVDKSYIDLYNITETSIQTTLNINGQVYYSVSEILKNINMKMVVDEENKKITISY